MKRAQTICALSAVISDWVEKTRHLGAIVPDMTGCIEFLSALQHLEKPKQRITPDFHKLIGIPKRIEFVEENLTKQLGLRPSQRELKRIQNQAIRIQRALAAETVEVLEQGVRVVLTGDQQVQVLEINGVPNECVANAVSAGIKKSQQLAAAKLTEMGGFPMKALLGEESRDLT